MVNDPIADMLTRIRNANQRQARKTVVPFSHLKQQIAHILKMEGYINSYKIIKPTTNNKLKAPLIVIELKYKDRIRVIAGLRRISKPGLRVYSPAITLPRVLNGLGIAIISTSHGLMTDHQARKNHLGGEVLAYVW